MRLVTLASTLAGLAAAAVCAHGAFAGPSGGPAAARDLSGFSGPLPAGTELVVRPIYRERASSGTMKQVACAAGAAGATCYVAR